MDEQLQNYVDDFMKYKREISDDTVIGITTGEWRKLLEQNQQLLEALKAVDEYFAEMQSLVYNLSAYPIDKYEKVWDEIARALCVAAEGDTDE